MKKVKIMYSTTINDEEGKVPIILHPIDGKRDMIEFSSVVSYDCTMEEKDKMVELLKVIPNPPYMDVIIDVFIAEDDDILDTTETWSRSYEKEQEGWR